MRDFLNGILTFIVTSSLTDDEFDSCELTMQIYDQDSYDFLAGILEDREAISTIQDRLVAYYLARGVEVEENSTASSNILIGGCLED